VFIVKFPVIVVLVYVAASLVNEDEYNIAFDNQDRPLFHIGIVIPLIVPDNL